EGRAAARALDLKSALAVSGVAPTQLDAVLGDPLGGQTRRRSDRLCAGYSGCGRPEGQGSDGDPESHEARDRHLPPSPPLRDSAPPRGGPPLAGGASTPRGGPPDPGHLFRHPPDDREARRAPAPP